MCCCWVVSGHSNQNWEILFTVLWSSTVSMMKDYDIWSSHLCLFWYMLVSCLERAWDYLGLTCGNAELRKRIEIFFYFSFSSIAGWGWQHPRKWGACDLTAHLSRPTCRSREEGGTGGSWWRRGAWWEDQPTQWCGSANLWSWSVGWGFGRQRSWAVDIGSIIYFLRQTNWVGCWESRESWSLWILWNTNSFNIKDCILI